MAKPLIDELTEQINGLPALPEVVCNIISINIDDTSSQEVAQILEKDAGLAVRVLKIANSAYFGLPREISTIRMAVTVLGVRLIKNLVLCSSMLEFFPRDKFKAAEFYKHWQYNFTAAVANRLLSARTRYPDAEEAFAAGLLHHIGLAFLVALNSEQYEAVLQRIPPGELASPELELEILGVDHAETGYILAQHLNLPEVLANPIRLHHMADHLPDNLSAAEVALVRQTALASRIAQLFVLPNSAACIDPIFDSSTSWFGIEKQAVADIMAETAVKGSDVLQSFLKDASPIHSYVEALQQSNLELVREIVSLLGCDKTNQNVTDR